MNEDDYERALSVELCVWDIEHECQIPVPLIYKGTHLDCGYRMDLVIAKQLLVELKAVGNLHPVDEAPLITYLRLSGLELGLLVNFAEMMLRDGIMHRANSGVAIRNQRRDRPSDTSLDPLSFEVIDAAIEAQYVLGSGLLRARMKQRWNTNSSCVASRSSGVCLRTSFTASSSLPTPRKSRYLWTDGSW